MKRLLAALLLAVGALVGWAHRVELALMLPVPVVFPSAHQRYAAALRIGDLDDTAAGRAWLDAADRALAQPAVIEAPFDRRAEFVEEGAAAWSFATRRGQRLTVTVEFDGPLFVDLFQAAGQDRVASALGPARLTYDVEDDGELIVRVQPEMNAAGAYRISAESKASLAFPVEGLSPTAVQSTFGDARDGGGRSHEGIDIFAARGTPVVAGADGWIAGSTGNRLGGNVVWLWSPTRGIRMYYAHLDRIAVAPGTRVQSGQVVGYVGNTGNARTTAPHLHFGVYATGDGAVDPLPYVCDSPCPAMRMTAPKRGERLMHKRTGLPERN